MTRIKQLEILFEQWQTKHKDELQNNYQKYHKKGYGDIGYIPKENFLYDGIIFEKEYEKSADRILFIGKECHSYDYDNELINIETTKTDDFNWMRKETKEHLENQKALYVFLKNIAMLSNAIISNNYDCPNKDAHVLYKVALINLNKRGGYKKCVWKTLKGYVENYQEEIRKEIEIIDPTVIICCGEDVKWLVEIYHLADERKIKLTYHPSCYCKSDIDKLYYLKTGEKPKKRS